jgi:hypothetical protein
MPLVPRLKTTSERVNLFGERLTVPKRAIESFGAWPFTVWETDSPEWDKTDRALRILIGDERDGSKGGGFDTTLSPRGVAFRAAKRSSRHETVDGTFGFQHGASVFSPALGSVILNMFGPTVAGSLVIDPFNGGATRPVLCASKGLRYVGTEIRQVEVDFARARLVTLGVDSSATVICDDGRNISRHASGADFCMTCPPYYSLERYKGGPNDLSMCSTYGEFCCGLSEVIASTGRALRPGSLSVWVSGLHRDSDGNLLAMHHALAGLHADHGFDLREEVIVYRRRSGAGTRVRNFFTGQGHLARTHEYVQVFRKR